MQCGVQWEEKATYNAWAGETQQDAFYTSTKTRQLYMDHVKAVVGRVNSLTNLSYAEVISLTPPTQILTQPNTARLDPSHPCFHACVAMSAWRNTPHVEVMNAP